MAEWMTQMQQSCWALLCCFSPGTTGYDGSPDAARSCEPDERCGLLDQLPPPSYDNHHLQGMNGGCSSSSITAHDQVVEQETLRRIVERTAENLIDVTGTGVERLQQADLAERTDEYLDVVGRMRELAGAQKRLHALPTTQQRSLTDVFQSSTPLVSSQDHSMMEMWCTKVKQSVEMTAVQDVGEMVVSLTWSMTD